MRKKYVTPESASFRLSAESDFLVGGLSRSISFTTDTSRGVTNENNIYSKKNQPGGARNIWE